VNGGDIRSLIAERDYLKQRVDEMEGVMGQAQTEIEKLRQENHQLKEENKSLGHQLKQMLGKIFKPQVKPVPDVNRPQRGAPRGHRGNSRRRPEEISEFVDIYPNKCDRCGGAIETNYEANFDEHVVEDIEIKKRVTCYRLHYGYCKRCQKAVRAQGPVNPNDRIGIQARGVGGYLRYLGLTYGKVARLFSSP
jgi:FtsZ-binding cell division protein ZapB